MNRIWSAGRLRRRIARPGPGAVRRRGAGAPAVWVGRLLQGGVLFLLLAGGAYGAVRVYRYVVEAPDLTVEEIRIKGIRALAAEEVAARAGVSRGDQILEIDLVAVDGRIEAHPRVASAVVRRILPRAIEIEVVERVPVALAARGSEMVGLDADGVLVPVYPEREQVRVPIVTGVPLDRFPLGAPAEHAGAAEALRCLSALPPGIRAQVSEVRVGTDEGVGLVLSGTGTFVRMGRGAYEEKVRRLAAALDHFAATGERKSYIDVRFQDVVTRP